MWRCRRGVRELDVVFGRFLDQQYPKLTSQEQRAFARLLEVQDPIILDWLFDRATPDDLELARIINQLKQSSGL